MESEVGGEVKSSGGKVGKVFGTALKLGSVAAVGGAVLAAGFLKGSLDEAREAQKVGAQTNAVIKSTGGIANVTAAGVGRLAGAISNKVGIDDEAIASGANLLLTFTNVRNEAGKGNKVFDQTVRAATDMSVALGTSLTGASMQLGKALNDPIKGVTKLQRSGVTFTDQQKEQITTLVNSGKTLQAQKIILAEVNKEFGGSAAAAATAGDKFKVAFGNLQESVGTALLPAFDGLLNVGTRLAGFLTNNIGPGMIALNGYIAPLIPAVKALFTSFSSGGAGISGLGASLAATGAALGSFFKGLLPTIVSFGQQLAAVVGPAISSIGNLIATQLLPSFRALLPVILPVAKFLLSVFGGAVIGAVKGFVQALKGAINVIAGIFKLVVALVHGDWSAAWKAVVQIAKGAFGLVLGAIKVWFYGGILSIFRGGVVRLLGLWKGGWASIRGIGSKALAGLRGIISAGVQAIVRLFLTGAARYVGIWRTLFKVVGALTKGGISLVRSIFSGGLSAIRALVVSAMGRVRGAFVSAMSAVRSAVSNGINAAKTAFSNGVRAIIGAASGLGGKILSAVGNLGGLLFNAGASVIGGLISGIKSMIGPLISAAHAVTALIPKHKGPPAKDARLLRPAGRAIMGGLIAGFDDGTPALEATLNRLSSRIQVGGVPRLDVSGTTGSSSRVGAGQTVQFNGPIIGVDPEAAMRTVNRRMAVAAQLAGQA